MYNNIDRLLKQISLGEDSSLELKEVYFKNNNINNPHADGMADELAAMANTLSGIFIIGVNDKSREITGIPKEKLDIVEEWIRNICNDRIIPQLQCNIKKISVKVDNSPDKYIIRIDVPKSLDVHKSPSGYFMRIGSSKRELSPELLARLFQQRSQTRIIRYDESIVPMAGLETLSEDLWSKYKTPLSSNDAIEFLAKAGLITMGDSGDFHPTVTGLLTASKMPQDFIPGASIQAVSYRGYERDASSQIDHKDFTSPVDEQIRDACRFVFKNMKVSAEKKPGRIEKPQYSMKAVFEAVVNAVAHRDYSIYGSKIRMHMFADRLELFSPGALPNTITIDSLSQRQFSRNETLTSFLARSLIELDFISTERHFIMDKRGEGVPVIILESEKISGKKPEYKMIDDTELKLTIWAAEV